MPASLPILSVCLLAVLDFHAQQTDVRSMFYGCNVSCNQLPTSSNGNWSALTQRFSPYSYFIIYKRKEEGRFLPDFRYRLEAGVSSPETDEIKGDVDIDD